MRAATEQHRLGVDPLRRRDPKGRRRGMTLVELLLVLVLLVLVGSLSAPLFEGSFATVRLRRGTDQVLAAWSEARTRSIEAGLIYQFRFQPEGNKFRVERWTGGLDEDPLLEDSSALETEDAEAVAEQTGVSTEEAELAGWTLEATLPEQISFSSAEGVSKDETGQRQVTRLDQATTTEWSEPILFYPDGRTAAASLLLKNNKEVYCRATLRSLTGVGRASEILGRDEVNSLGSR